MLKEYKKNELCQLLAIKEPTFNKWVEDLNLPVKKHHWETQPLEFQGTTYQIPVKVYDESYTKEEVQRIFDHVGIKY